VARVSRLYLSEQTRGDIILKTWKANLAKNKRLTREVKIACEQALSSLDKESLDIEGDNISEALGQIDIVKNQLNSKTSMEEAHMTIQQLKQIDLLQINKWIVNPNLWLQAIFSKAKIMQDKLSHIGNKLYTFEANDTTKPSRLVVQFVGRCV
jgi:hypothetical protein